MRQTTASARGAYLVHKGSGFRMAQLLKKGDAALFRPGVAAYLCSLAGGDGATRCGRQKYQSFFGSTPAPAPPPIEWRSNDA